MSLFCIYPFLLSMFLINSCSFPFVAWFNLAWLEKRKKTKHVISYISLLIHKLYIYIFLLLVLFLLFVCLFLLVHCRLSSLRRLRLEVFLGLDGLPVLCRLHPSRISTHVPPHLPLIGFYHLCRDPRLPCALHWGDARYATIN